MKNLLKKLLCAVLSACLLLSLAACGEKSSSSDGGGTLDGSAASDSETQSEKSSEPAAELTLDNAEAKLVYAKDNYAVAAFHGPDGDIGAHFCDAGGEKVRDCFGSVSLGNGWTLLSSNEFPEGYDYSEIGLSVTDYDAKPTADGHYPSADYLKIEQMPEDEMRDIGLVFLDGHCCYVGPGRMTYGGYSFGFSYGITWFDDYYFTPFTEIDGFADRFTYFAGDGTPLDEYFEGYTELEITPMTSMFDVMLVNKDVFDKEKNESMCDELKKCDPYMIYTGLDGTQQKFDILED